MPRLSLIIHKLSIFIRKKMSDNLVCVRDFEEYARDVLSKNTFLFFRSGAGAEQTLASNGAAFSKLKIRPRCLRNVAERDLSTIVLGEKIKMPIGVSPTALQGLVHQEGECATARAAQAMGTVFILSAAASRSIEEVAQAAPSGIKWLQLFIYKDRQYTKNLVQRAENAGFKALVLTVDCPIVGRRLADTRNKSIAAAKNNFNNLIDSTLDWKDFEWLCSITNLPVVAKGILTAEDAILAANSGASAILVSNHGGRQLDGVPATIEALPEIVNAVGDRVEIYIDGGVTDGTDVYKALALGARLVLVGRPPIWGLTHSGADGARKVLEILRNELDYAMAITGCSSVKDLDGNMVVSVGYMRRRLRQKESHFFTWLWYKYCSLTNKYWFFET